MKRLKRIILSGFVLLAAWYPAPADAQGDVRTTYAVVREGRVTFQAAGVAEPFRVLFLSDTHFTVEDSRGEPYRKYSERMGGAAVRPENYGVSNGRERQLLKVLAQARKDSVELVVLGGDMLNFPSLASVDSLLAIMTHSGLDWVYIAGNHDWHYEGEAGTSAEQRSRWESTALAPLYQGGDPLARAEVRHGVNLVFIDNSTLEVTPGQLDFLRREIARGLPMVLFMHVPVYFPGQNIDYSCGHPQWDEVHDCYYEIERRQPWPKEGHTATTQAFCELVRECPQIIGCFAGHTHERAIDFYNGRLQYVVGANHSGDAVTIRFEPPAR